MYTFYQVNFQLYLNLHHGSWTPHTAHELQWFARLRI